MKPKYSFKNTKTDSNKKAGSKSFIKRFFSKIHWILFEARVDEERLEEIKHESLKRQIHSGFGQHHL